MTQKERDSKIVRGIFSLLMRFQFYFRFLQLPRKHAANKTVRSLHVLTILTGFAKQRLSISGEDLCLVLRFLFWMESWCSLVNCNL